LVISDALNMKAVAKHFPEPGQLEWEAFQAGNDILCFSDHVKKGIELICEKATAEEIDSAYEKIQDLKQKLGVFDFQPFDVPVFDWESHSTFQTALAEKYITTLHGSLESNEFKTLAESGKVAHRVFFAREKTVFEKKLNENLNQELTSIPLDRAEKVLISVFVPSQKPLNQFGMDLKIIAEIKVLLDSKRCILIHFGNPLALKHLGKLEDFEAVICCYQGFEEVQLETASFFTD